MVRPVFCERCLGHPLFLAVLFNDLTVVVVFVHFSVSLMPVFCVLYSQGFSCYVISSLERTNLKVRKSFFYNVCGVSLVVRGKGGTGIFLILVWGLVCAWSLKIALVSPCRQTSHGQSESLQGFLSLAIELCRLCLGRSVVRHLVLACILCYCWFSQASTHLWLY